MSSHVHLIIGQDSGGKLQDIVRDLKKYTSSKIIEAIGNNHQESRRELLMYLFERAGQNNSNNKRYQFWQQHNHPIELSTNEMIEQRLAYIHHNPVEAGIVLSAHEYLYSSAVNYAGLPEKLIEVMYIE
jgi:REP element-mobilizing transposase RayT